SADLEVEGSVPEVKLSFSRLCFSVSYSSD
ncbi:hypothetical protein A2U01_0047868, partial [Trifolium medium]|nr:hypothetical protein [Trifolium medium]